MGNCQGAPHKDGDAAAKPKLSRQPTFSAVHTRLRRDASVTDTYKFGKVIGKGGFSTVRRVTDRETAQEWACKIMSLPAVTIWGVSDADGVLSREEVLTEIDILMSLRHPNIVNFTEYYDEGHKVYVIMELLSGGELLQALLDKEQSPDGKTAAHYSEADAHVIFRQVLAGIRYMHEEKGIVHRDLKLSNLLLARKGDITSIKIADFGVAKRYRQAPLSTFCGTPQYMAPEVIGAVHERYTYGKECDLWSAGVILFILLGGYYPFDDASEPRLFKKICDGKYDMNHSVWAHVSASAKDLIVKLLVIDPAKRLTIDQVLAQPWMEEEERLSHRKDLPQTISKMRASMRTMGLQ